MSIFSPKDFKDDKMQNFMRGIKDLESKKKIIRKWQDDILSNKIYQLTETQQDIFFIADIFGEVLEYDYRNSEKWNLEIKPRTEQDATRPDGVLGYFSVDKKDENKDENLNTTKHEKLPEKPKNTRTVKAVIELKGANITLDKNQNRKDFKGSAIEQAFSYIPKMAGKCNWVIISNLVEIRFYHASNSSKYELFEVSKLLEPENFAKFLFLLHKSKLFGQEGENNYSDTDILYAEKRAAEERITIEFYNAYKDKREILFYSLCRTNPEKDKLEILATTQKLIDRLIFICFTRDAIPMANVLGEMKQITEKIYFEQDNLLWELLIKTFKSYNKGFSHKIPLFNGGLFSENEFLDTLTIKDFQLLPLIDFLLKYDFQSELNVTILGHIFEQSIADLEILKEEITKNQDTNLKPTIQNQRKTDGVFYTPDYITQYIIKNSVGTWLEEQKEILLEKHTSENIAFWEDYKIILQNIKILDPACGSGAFLVEVFNFLLMEWQIVLNELQKTTIKTKKVAKKQGGLTFDETKAYWNIRKSIIENNIFGVDLNMESVEITKLALWILQANKTVPLSDLTNNIKRGNSLIDDKNITEWAFDWKKEFREIMDNGGFDIIIGNPPYTYRNTNNENQKPYYNAKYQVSEGNYEAYKFFIEKSIFLLNKYGKLGFITSASFLIQSSFTKLRKLLVEETAIKLLAPLGGNVFEEATVDTIILVVSKKLNDKQKIKIILPKKPTMLNDTPSYYIAQNRLQKNKDYLFDYLLNDLEHQIMAKLFDNFPKIESGFEFGVGINTGYIKSELVAAKKLNEKYHLMVSGNDISRYGVVYSSGWIMYDKEFVKSKKELGRSLPDEKFFVNDKILIVRTRNLSLKRRIIATLDKDKKYNLNRISNIIAKENYQLIGLLGILNSNLFQWFFAKKFFDYEIKPIYLRECPLADVNNDKLNTLVSNLLSYYQGTEKLSDAFVRLLPVDFKPIKVSRKLEKGFELDFTNFIIEVDKGKPKKKLSEASFKIKQQIENDFLQIQQEVIETYENITRIETELNHLVYKLYDLTEEEITIIENEK